MPIIVNPSGARNEPPATVTSPDGRLTATVDPQHAGMLLEYDGTAEAPTRVRFTRQSGSRDVPVRSGDLAYAPGGYAIAYDHEVGLDATAAYSATPYFADGSTGSPSLVSILSSAAKGRAGQPGMWLKDLEDPTNSLEPLVTDISESSIGGRVARTATLGSSYPVAVSRSSVAPTFTATIVTESPEEHAKVSRLLGVPGYAEDDRPPSVLLAQFMPQYQRLDQYVVATSVKPGVASGNPSVVTRTFVVELAEVARPDPTGAPLRIPGRSYEDVGRIYTAYSDIPQSNASYVQLATGSA